jgi:hypothetical protein
MKKHILKKLSTMALNGKEFPGLNERDASGGY